MSVLFERFRKKLLNLLQDVLAEIEENGFGDPRGTVLDREFPGEINNAYLAEKLAKMGWECKELYMDWVCEKSGFKAVLLKNNTIGYLLIKEKITSVVYFENRDGKVRLKIHNAVADAIKIYGADGFRIFREFLVAMLESGKEREMDAKRILCRLCEMCSG